MGIPNFSPMERVQAATLLTARTYLEAELATMTTEAGGDLTIPTPTDYVEMPAEEETSQTLVEIITITADPNAAGAPLEYGSGRVTTRVEWEARVVLINDGRWDSATFKKALDRFGAAFMAIFLVRYPRLGYADGTVMQTLPNGKWRYTVDLQRDPGGKRLRRVHVPFVTTVQERLT